MMIKFVNLLHMCDFRRFWAKPTMINVMNTDAYMPGGYFQNAVYNH